MQRGLFVVLVTLVVLAGGLPGPATAAEPTVSIAVDGTPMSSGDRQIVPEDPVLRVNASASTTVERVVVRVDDTTVRTWAPGTERASKRTRLDLRNEPQTVQVVVTGSDGSVASTQVTVEKDAVAPFVGFTEPFESTQFGQPPDEVPVSGSRVTLAGTLEDAVGVEYVRITREHKVQELTDYTVSTETHVVRDPGEEFSQELFLGPGENDVTVVVQDRYGNSRRYALSFPVTDRTEPSISLDPVPERTSSSTVFVNGTATDNVQVDSISYAVFGDVSRRSVVVGQGREVDPERRRIDFGQEVELTPGPNRITVWATDTSGNEVSELVIVDYARNVEPTVSIDEARTHLVADEAVHVYGAARDGRVRSLSVETVDENGTVVDFQQVYDGGDVWNDVSFEEELALAATGETAVIVRAVDADGVEHVTRYAVPTPTASTGGEPTPEPNDATDAGVENAGNEAGAETGGENAATNTNTATAVEDGGFGAFAVAALLVVLLSLARLRDATIDVPIEKYVDFDDTRPSLPSLPRFRR
ncbi:hypothetical protein [Salinigranum sp. GCM10025319]|uniref:hypothetical protein n=1 Tax=Salinigranum sp. GCM10025319 TaxID=3252687 RepID=UPI003605B340